VNALLGKRATSAVFRGAARDIADEDYVVEWTALLAMRIESLR
ncbi:TetR/AcrR family transcriptional regulator, partial [Mycobacteroides abscessus subsp. massiliense]